MTPYTQALAELQPLRPRTQPYADIESARLDIKKLEAIDMRPIQICLFFIVLALLEYLFLPPNVVHGVAFMTLCVGLSLAIYLSNR